MVAEKSAICRWAGAWVRIQSTSSAKPIRSISSASSSTSPRSPSSLSEPRRMWSITRPGRADDDVHAAIELPELDVIILAAVDRDGPQPLETGGVALERFGNLDRQLPGRREHEDLRHFLLQVDPLEHRHGERRGLARAGLRLAEHIAAREQERDRAGLDRRRRQIAGALDRLEQRTAQVELIERGFGILIGQRKRHSACT